VLRSQKKGWHRVVRPLDALKGDDWDVVPSSQAGEQYLQLPLHPRLRSCSPARTLPGVPDVEVQAQACGRDTGITEDTVFTGRGQSSDESGLGHPPRCCSRGIRLRIRRRYRLRPPSSTVLALAVDVSLFTRLSRHRLRTGSQRERPRPFDTLHRGAMQSSPQPSAQTVLGSLLDSFSLSLIALPGTPLSAN
jgi:hypothetical protein